jgi:hypothetical protein
MGTMALAGMLASTSIGNSDTAKHPDAPAAPSRPWPDATNTGVPEATKLTVLNGDLSVTTAGTVIDSKDIHGCVHVTAPGVVIRRSRIRCNFAYAVLSNDYIGARLLIEDSEIDCRNAAGQATGATAVGDRNFIARRLNIHHCVNGFDVDFDATIEESWIHDLLEDEDAHTDGIQIAVGRNLVIEHNAIFVKIGSSAIISHPTSMENVLIKDNLLAGGAWTLYCPERSSNVRVIGNRFSTFFSPKGGTYGPWTGCDKIAEARDNVWQGTGQPLPGQPIPPR